MPLRHKTTMIKSFYPCFQRWSAKGSVWIISDTHFDDPDCKLMSSDWPYAICHARKINKRVHQNDTLIHLGDVGDPSYMKFIRGHKVLITGNHDRGASFYEPYFDEIYTGPLFVGEKILLSHEPIAGLDWCINFHGHDHNGVHYYDDSDCTHVNVASNVIGYYPLNMGMFIKMYGLQAKGIHRDTIDKINTRGDQNVV